MLFILCALILTGIGSATSAQQIAEVTIADKNLTVTAATPEVTFILLRVMDPDGQMICDTSSEGPPIQWVPPANAPDGTYSYEVRVGTEKKKSKRDDSQQQKTKVRPWMKSGNLFIRNGAIVISTEPEAGLLRQIYTTGERAWAKLVDFIFPSAFADVLHYDDVITTGSACVGFDCIDGESFGSFTIKLKENNLQLGFEDTSEGVFPTNDWKIQINDSTSGGASYFTIWDVDGGRRPFTIEAGAPAHALYVEDYGRIGIGTSIPYVEVHVVDGDSPTLRLDQDGSSGWAAQAWDIAGNETNFFIRDVTNGSKLCLRIQPGTPSNTLTLKNDGKVGIGTWSPEAPLELETVLGTDAQFLFDQVSGASGILSAATDAVIVGSKSDHPLNFYANNLKVGTLDTGGNLLINGNLEIGSSREIKQNIKPVELEEAIYALNELRPVKFEYKSRPAEEIVGFVAEDVPDLVATESRRTTSPMDVVAVLTKVVQEQQKTIAELSRKLSELEYEMKATPSTH